MKNKTLFGLIVSILLIGIFMPNAGNFVSANLSDGFFEDFEGSVFPAWTTTGLWHLEDNDSSMWDMYGLPSDSHYMWYGDNRTGNYNTSGSNSGDLTSDTFDLLGFGNSVYLEFWSWVETEVGTSYDQKSVYINDGAGWSLLGNLTFDGSTPRWQLITFDISSYVNLSTVSLRFSFDTVHGFVNDYRGWVIDDIKIVTEPTGFFDLWINQEYNALVGETHWMDFNIVSHFSHDMNVSIKVEIFTPNGTVILYNVSNYFFPALGSWNLYKNFTFIYTGHYDVRLSLVDDLFVVWETRCWWEVAVYADEYFDLWIIQDYYAYVGETQWMDFYADSYFSHSMMNVTIKIEINGPDGATLFYSDTENISSFGTWYISLNYTFMSEGMYEVYFYLVDDMGYYWETWCNWEVKPFYEHFELWIDQENFATVNNYGFMGFNIESYFSHNMSVEIKIEIIDPSGSVDVIFYNSNVFFLADSSWFYPVSYLLSNIGHYDVHMTLVDDIGMFWETWCWYEVFDFSGEFLWVDIYQDQHAFVGDNRWMDFVVYSNFSNFLYDVTIEAKVVRPSLAVDPLFYYSSETLVPNGWWKTDASYTFTEVGYYEIIFNVTLTDGTSWIHTCGWEITPLDLEIWIDQANFIKIGQTGEMKFSIKSHFSEARTFGANLTISKDGKIMYQVSKESITLGPNQEWNEVISYTFDKLGHWDVIFEIWSSDHTQIWTTDCWWDVQPADILEPFIDSDRVAQVNVTEEFFVGVYNYFGNRISFNVMVSILHPNGTEELIYSGNVTDIEPGMKWKILLRYTFVDVGKYPIKVVAINGGNSFFIDSFFDVTYEIEPTTSVRSTTEPPTDTPTLSLTPGFELFLVPLVVIPLVLSKKRRR
jgi:hypothetical protein